MWEFVMQMWQTYRWIILPCEIASIVLLLFAVVFNHRKKLRWTLIALAVFIGYALPQFLIAIDMGVL